MSWLDDTVAAVRDYDRSRPRTLQAEVGWSEVGGCRAALGFRLDGAFADDTDTWAAQRGTAIGDYLEAILARPGTRTQVDTSYRGIPGHADIVDESSVTDIKTTTLVNSRLWAGDFSLLRPKRNQAHGYAAGLVDAGELPADCTVRLLIVPVDGKFGDWWAYEEPFDRALADEGADRLADTRARLAAGLPLPKDKPYAWCQDWCGFFALCRNPAEAADLPEITDPELAAAIARYGELNAITGPADKEKKALAGLIRGFNATAGPWRVTTSAPGDDKYVLDEEKIRADYEARGIAIPEVVKPGQGPKLTVTRIKDPKAAGET